MAKEFEEGIQEVPAEALSDELKGTIIDEDLSYQNRLWIGTAVTLITVIMVVSWGILYFKRTPHTEALAKLQNREYIAAQLSQSARTLRLPHASTQQVWESVEDVVFIAGTQLRTTHEGQSPLIPERQLAMIEALEALLRMEIEGIVHPENAKDQEAFNDLFFRLGLLELEYYDKGSLERVALSKAARLQSTLNREKRNLGAYADVSALL